MAARLSGGLWSDNANWQDGIVGSGAGNTAAFNTIELVDDNIVLLDAPQTIGNLVFGDSDPGSTGNWIVDDGGIPGNTLTLAAAGAPTLTVNALGADAAARLAAPLAGTAGLTKIGPGPLVLDRINTLTGAINVNGGTLRLDPGSSLNTGSGTVNVGVTAGVRLQVNGGSLSAGGLVTIGSGTGGGNVGGLFTLDSGTATFGAVRTNSDSGSTIRVNGGTFTATDVNIRRNSAATPDFGSGFLVFGGAATVGTIGLGTNNSNGALTVAGGSLVATGTVTVGNQATAGRGGAMRVIGGTFTSTDTVNGVVLARTSGTNANNVASAAFTGGVSTVEKITLGFDATVTAGSATLTVNGGTLYLGAGGIVRNGAGTFASTLNFSAGTVGAKSNWSTSLPITLPSGGNVVFKAADASDLPRDITLTGGLSGAGGLTKAGLGTLALAAANTFTGPVAVNAGVLRVDGSLAPGDLVSVNGGGILAGTGTRQSRRAPWRRRHHPARQRIAGIHADRRDADLERRRRARDRSRVGQPARRRRRIEQRQRRPLHVGAGSIRTACGRHRLHAGDLRLDRCRAGGFHLQRSARLPRRFHRRSHEPRVPRHRRRTDGRVH